MTTREKIIEAARQHFAEFGLQHASVRAITQLAGVNSALVRYHFGSKDMLYKEVIEGCAKSMIKERAEALENLRQRHAPGPIPIPCLLDTYARPVLRNSKDPGRDAAIYLRLFGRMYTEPSDDLRKLTQTQFTEIQLAFIQEICRTLPQLAREVVVFRFGLLVGALAFLGSSTGVIEELSEGALDTKADDERSLALFIESFAPLLEAPSMDGPAQPGHASQR